MFWRRGTRLVGFVAIVLSLLAPQALAGGSFIDDDGNVHESSIEAIAAEGITKGCNPPVNDRYCPDSSVTRGQMAAFLRRAFSLPTAINDYFVDDETSEFEGDINALAEAGITKGCNPPLSNQFCPDGFVTREQMAAFLRRAFEYPTATTDFFLDDQTSIFEADINAIAAEGVTKGCNPPINDRYCPNDLVKRDQMASFLARALSLKPILPTPTSRSILFVYGGIEVANLATIEPDGSQLTFLGPIGGLAGCPERSPDGTRIAFQRSILVGAVIDRVEVVVSRVDGSDIQLLANGYCPTWSPDGTQIAVYNLNGDPGIWVLDDAGTIIQRVSEIAGAPDWSPDGSLLAVVGEGFLYTIPTPGSTVTGTSLVFGGDHPEWAPDSSEVVYDKEADGVRQIFVINRDGSSERQITTGGTLFGGFDPAWSPDGSEVVFSSDRDGGWDLYIIGIDGTGLRRLTTTAEDEFPGSPDW